MNEKNHQTLRNALERLPLHSPPAGLWEAIDRQLTSAETLETAIAELPTYAPPVAVWERIADELEQPVQVRRLRPAWWSAAAAAVLILAVGTYLWSTREPQLPEQVQVVYAELDQPGNVLKVDWDDDEAVMAEVVEAFAQKAAFVQELDNQSLLAEWQELNQAKEEIKSMLNKYGKDADLVQTIADIERQRSAVVKRMATEI